MSNRYLRQSTACTIVVGQMVDSEDGFTPVEDLTIAQADVRLSKNGGAFAQVNEATTAPHGENGYYLKAFNTTDTNTLGDLFLAVPMAGTLGFDAAFTVLPQQVYDSLMLGSDLLQVDTTQVGGTAQTAGDLVADTNDIQSRLPVALVSGRIDASVGAMAANVMTAAAAASDLTTELQSGLATAAALATVDTVVDAIQAQTDQLAFTSGSVRADIRRVIGAAVQENGSTETNWGAAP